MYVCDARESTDVCGTTSREITGNNKGGGWIHEAFVSSGVHLSETYNQFAAVLTRCVWENSLPLIRIP